MFSEAKILFVGLAWVSLFPAELPAGKCGVYFKQDTVLLSNTIKHIFSAPVKPDVFKVTVSGKSILDGQVKFQIFDSNNRIIHNETFAANEMLWDLDGADITPKEETDSITKRIERFFAPGNFIYPAISIAEDFDEDNSEKDIWKEIKADKAAIGFIYTHGYEGTYAIVYSKKKKKAVCYYYSD